LEQIGKITIILGISLVVIGGILYLLGKAGMQRFPGTLVYNFPGGVCVIPILGSILFSIILTIIINIIFKSSNK
jgi:hypothetical protein